MKQHSGELFELIQGLTLSEKRYCSLHLQKHSGARGNRYARLFDFLCKQQVYDTVLAKAYMSYQNKPNHYAVLKKQLFEQLLDALYQYDLFSNAGQQLLRGIHQCHLLLQKGLFKACERRIKSLARTAEQMNHYEAQLQLQQLKMMMKARNYYRNETEAGLKHWADETDAIVEQLKTTNRYRYLSSRVFKIQYESGARGRQQAERMDEVLQLPEFTSEIMANNNRAKLDYLQVKALYHFTALETEKAVDYNARFLQLLDDNPILLQQHADRYFSVLNNYLIDCLVLKRYDTLATGLQKMRTLPQVTAFKRLANFEANVFRLGYVLELNYMIGSGNYADAYKAIPDIIAGFNKFGDRIVKHNRITLQYLMAYACFMLKRYDEALGHLQHILQEKETAVAENIQLAARMLQLLCHYEKGDYLLLDSLIKSVRRYLKADKSADIQRAVISFIQPAIRGVIPVTAKWMLLQNKLQKLSAGGATAAGMSMFNYREWVERKVGPGQ
ncbi:MAG TPA: hypothetical protein VK174_06500 [Chitinophagales bacterium]|nr:hypothetical protein [Chitinophagales bacterium]